MDFPTLMAELGHLSVDLQKLAAIGAALRLQKNGQTASPEVEAALRDAVSTALPGALANLTQDEINTALNFIVYHMEDARELLGDPARPPVWRIDDAAVLQSMGDLSRMLPRRMLAFAKDRPELSSAFAGRFLDAGTGVGAIALEAAALCPTLQVVGLDIWEPSLALARANVAASSYSDRIEIRNQSVTELDEKAAYTVAFLAAPFMDRSVVEAALDRLAVAIAGGGYLIVSVYVPPADRVASALTVLRRVRHGGHPWTTDDMGAAMKVRGFTDIALQPGLPGRGFSPTLMFARRSPG